METIGQKLKRVRLEKGLTLEDAHKRTKVHLNILKAIEEDSVVNFNPVYIKGFIKIYSNFLGIDPSGAGVEPAQVKPVIAEKNQPARQEVKPEEKKETISQPVFQPIKIIKRVLPLVIAVLAIFILFKIGKFIVVKTIAWAKRPKAVMAVAVNKEAKKSQKPKPAASSTVVKPRREEASREVKLVLRAKDDCWISVKVDSRTVFQGTLKKGRFESWIAKEKIEFSLANAAAVEVEANEKIIPALGRRGQSVKNVVINKDGLISAR